jgi:RimJ/RimL family protein N-acetyltransferase
LVIRPFQDDDLEPYLEFMTDETATRHLMFTDEQKTVVGATELFEYVISSYSSDEPIDAYAIALKGDGFIGSCGMSGLHEDGLYECYYSLLPKQLGDGYATEATKALLDYCFEAGAVEIHAYVNADNPAGAAVANTAGMSYRGTHTHPPSNNEAELFSKTR